MKNLVGIVLGALLAITIGCAAKQSKSAASPQATMAGGAPDVSPSPADSAREEIDQLDTAITSEMSKLDLARPTAAPLTCVAMACAREMSQLAAAATAPTDASCKGKTEMCTDVCSLGESICKNAGRICQLASQLGGTDDNANDKCNQGKASCDAATQRCCGCM